MMVLVKTCASRISLEGRGASLPLAVAAGYRLLRMVVYTGHGRLGGVRSWSRVRCSRVCGRQEVDGMEKHVVA